MFSDFEDYVAGVKPCPFCGGTDITTSNREFFRENGLKVLFFKCEGCGCRVIGGVYEDYEGAFESALEAWNRRAHEK